MGGLNMRWLVNAGLLVLPIATTLGILFGLQKHRELNGQDPLFAPGPGDGPDNEPSNGVKNDQYCQKSYGIQVETEGQEYTLNPNQWGWEEGDPGSLCVDVITFNNKTYATRTTAPEFSVVWEYPPGPETAPVHAFSNIKVDGGVFPTTLKSIEQVNIDLEWTYGIGNKTAAKTDVSELTDHDVNTNVAIDMFIDKDKTKAQDPTKAEYEVMVWWATIGPAAQPLGYADGIVVTKTVQGVTLDLYYGENDQTKQKVFTWATQKVTEDFKGDIAALLTELTSSTKENYPSSSDYMGYFSLGTEALSADTTVTFHVPLLSIDVQTSAST